ncbi:MAG TPA: hypothetical protein DEA40_09280 [Parvularcula sp.]|nr:hypothetical protein [Parvularcula sp.]HBS34773.1 hypothetical protein [Parvularcula sp.]
MRRPIPCTFRERKKPDFWPFQKNPAKARGPSASKKRRLKRSGKCGLGGWNPHERPKIRAAGGAKRRLFDAGKRKGAAPVQRPIGDKGARAFRL